MEEACKTLMQFQHRPLGNFDKMKWSTKEAIAVCGENL